MYEHNALSAAGTVGALMAPVVALLRSDDEGLRVLVDGALHEGVAAELTHAAPAVARVYMRLAPPPGGAARIVSEFPEAALDRFGDQELVALGAECLHVAQVPRPVEALARAVFVADALAHGEQRALEGAVVSCWWCALRSARLRAVDPIEEAAVICRYAARVA